MQPDDDREVPERQSGDPESVADEQEPFEQPADSLPIEAEPADVLEQQRTLPPDDEYPEG